MPGTSGAVWRRLYEKVKVQQQADKVALNGTDSRVRAGDGDFFAKVAELLKRNAEEEERRARASDGAQGLVGDDAPGRSRFSHLADDCPSAQDDTGLLSDALAANIEALYLEILHSILHSVGCETDAGDKASLYMYAQAAFNFDDQKHNELLEVAKIKEAPKILLHVEVIEAKDLISMDVNGLSDTFCTLYLTSNKNQQYNTTVKLATLCPTWNEYFCLSVENPEADELCIEAWDFDPAETVHEKMKKVGEVKGIRGWRKWAHEFVTTGKSENEFIGSSVLPLKSINASGEIRWCELQKHERTEKRGNVKVKLVFSSQKNNQASFKAHRNLIRLLLLYHLENTKVESYLWDGNFAVPAETILTQHLVHSGLPTVEDKLAKWIEYASVHGDHPINFEVYFLLLLKLMKPLQNNMFDNEKELLFWEATKKIIQYYLNRVRKLHMLKPSDSNIHQLATSLRVISHLRYLKMSEKFVLFTNLVHECGTSEDCNCSDFLVVTKYAIIQGVEDWYGSISDNINDSECSTELRLNHFVKITQDALYDLTMAVENYDKIFKEHVQLEYAVIFFSAHERKITELMEPFIKEGHHILRPLKFTSELPEAVQESEALSLGMTLFDVYLKLQRFVNLGIGLHKNKDAVYKISEYYLWFRQCVSLWLDIAHWKALKRIRKAVELDELVCVSSTSQYSSSAIDTIDIYYQMKLFWETLSWPDPEGSYIFITKIVDDICLSSVFYVELMTEKVENIKQNENISEDKFHITKEWCLAINNMDYIWHSIIPLVSELGVNDNMKALDVQNSNVNEQCRNTLQLVIDNTVETVADKITDQLDTAAGKMMPTIKKFLLEGADISQEEKKNNIDKIMQYLDNNLTILCSELKTEIFKKVLSIMWGKVAKILSDIVATSLEERQPRIYYINLKRALEDLLDYFSEGNEQQKTFYAEALVDVKEVLSLYSMETTELIQKFYLERLDEQNSSVTSPFGLITIRAGFLKNSLLIQILSCRNLLPMDSNGSCDPYVEISLLPAERFIGIQKQRTKPHKKTLFPLFDETFAFQLPLDLKQRNNCLVLLTIKDKDFLRNEFVGEAFTHFTDIMEIETEDGLQDLEQIHLNLSVPQNIGSSISKALQLREGDKLAKEFIKKQRSKVEAH